MTDLSSLTTHHSKETNGVTLHVVTAGPSTGEPVVCLHGFPEFWYGWRRQIPALVDAGYHVIVPDQRGYNLSDKPRGLDAYTLETLATDIVGLLDAFEYDRANFLGHDWGAAVLWQTLLAYPERVRKAIPMNIPHPAVFDSYLFSDVRQTINSSYMYLFQLSWVAEWLLKRRDFRGLQWFLDTTNREAAFSSADRERYREAWSQPRAVTAMLNWYRSLFRRDPGGVPSLTVEPETLVIWGMQDPLLDSRMAEDSLEYCPNGRLETVPDATHWLQHERPKRVNDLVCSFFEER